MRVACYKPMTIKTKADAKEFLRCFTGELYVETEKEDAILESYCGKNEHYKGQKWVSTRPKSDRGNIFAPYVQTLESAEDYIYHNRKHFNRVIK